MHIFITQKSVATKNYNYTKPALFCRFYTHMHEECKGVIMITAKYTAIWLNFKISCDCVTQESFCFISRICLGPA